tara:strand:- start:974 stop:1636 length:663 start_codon:yes stop_codon:yes gene_type:complete
MIVVEIKNSDCGCKHGKEVLSEDAMDVFTDFLTGQGSAVSQALADYVAEVIIEMVLDEFAPNFEESYPAAHKILVKTVAAIDLDDIMALTGMRGDKKGTCQRIAGIIVTGMERALVSIVAKEMGDMIKGMAPEGGQGAVSDLLASAISVLGNTTQLSANVVAAVFSEQTKGSLNDKIATTICEFDFSDAASKILGDASGDLAKVFGVGGKEIKSFLGDLF